jgi:UDP-perosamine 4-acetyltransferase
MNTYYILGNGGFANEVLEQIFLQNNTDKIFGGFIVLKDDKAILVSDDGVEPFTYPVDAKFIVGTGNGKWRNRFISHFYKYYRATTDHFPNIIADSAHISKMSKMGIGNVFCAFSMTNADVVLGNFNLFNVYSVTCHNNIIGDYNIFSPKSCAMGGVVMGDFNFLGAGVTITPSISIGTDNTISAGEYIFEDLTNRQFFQSGIVSDKP